MKSQAHGIETDKNQSTDISSSRTITSPKLVHCSFQHFEPDKHQFLEANNFHFISFQIYQLNRSNTKTIRISTTT